MESDEQLPAPLYFLRPRAGTLKIGEEALREMLSFSQLRAQDPEAGGVMIGRHIVDTDDVVVDMVTIPMEADRRSRMGFYRAQRQHQERIDREWKRAKGRRVYLGEWHTHPEPVPTPSSIDRNDWAKHLRDDRVDAAFLHFVIVGQQELLVWEGSRGSLDVQRLRTRPGWVS